LSVVLVVVVVVVVVKTIDFFFSCRVNSRQNSKNRPHFSRRMSIFLRTTKSSPITKRFTSFPLFRTHTHATAASTFRKSMKTMMSLSRAAVPAPPSIRRTSAGDKNNNNRQDQRRGEQVRTFAFGARKAPKGQLPEREPNMGLDPENAQAKVRS
jgi:hypothetical protein